MTNRHFFWQSGR